VFIVVAVVGSKYGGIFCGEGGVGMTNCGGIAAGDDNSMNLNLSG